MGSGRPSRNANGTWFARMEKAVASTNPTVNARQDADGAFSVLPLFVARRRSTPRKVLAVSGVVGANERLAHESEE